MTSYSLKLDLKIRKCDRKAELQNEYQHLAIIREGYIPPDVLKSIELPAPVNSNMGLVIYGSAPNWLYAYLVRQYSSVAWIGCYYPILEAAIVVKTNVPQIKIGKVIPITLSPEEILENATRADLEKQKKALELLPPQKPLSPKKLNGQIQLKVNNSLAYQRLVIDAINIPPQSLMTLFLPQELDFKREIVFDGSAPLWLFSYLVERCKEAPWIACHNMYNGAVIVESKDSNFAVGNNFKLIEKIPCPAIIVGGLPDSGKSVLTYALEQTLIRQGYNNRVHTLRAHWDGHGDWYLAMANRKIADYFSTFAGNPPTTPQEKRDCFEKYAQSTKNLRSTTDLAIIDVGGYPQESDLVLVRCCTHYIIICQSANKGDREQIEKLHDFFQSKKRGNLKPLAVIHSVWESKLEVISTEPYLEIKAGKWERGVTDTVPDVLLQEVIKLFNR